MTPPHPPRIPKTHMTRNPTTFTTLSCTMQNVRLMNCRLYLNLVRHLSVICLDIQTSTQTLCGLCTAFMFFRGRFEVLCFVLVQFSRHWESNCYSFFCHSTASYPLAPSWNCQLKEAQVWFHAWGLAVYWPVADRIGLSTKRFTCQSICSVWKISLTACSMSSSPLKRRYAGRLCVNYDLSV